MRSADVSLICPIISLVLVILLLAVVPTPAHPQISGHSVAAEERPGSTTTGPSGHPSSAVAPPACANSSNSAPIQTLDLLNGTSVAGIAASESNLVGPSALSPGPYPGTLFVVGARTGNLELVNTTTESVYFDDMGLTEPDAVQYDAGEDRVYVADAYTGTLSVYGAANGTHLTTIAVGSDPDSLALDPGRHTLFVANYGSTLLSIINTSTDSLVANVTVGDGANSLAIDPNRSTLVLAMDNYLNGGNLTFLNTTNDSVAFALPLPSNPSELALDTAHGTVFVSASIGRVYAVGLSNRTLFGNYSSVPFGRAIAFDPATGQLLVADSVGDTVGLVTPGGVGPTPTVAVGSLPLGFLVQPSNDTAFVANWGSANLTELDLSTFATRSLRLGVEPTAIAVSPIDGRLFIADGASSSVLPATGFGALLTGGSAAGVGPGSLAVDAADGLLIAGDLGAIGFEGDNLTFMNLSTLAPVATVPLPGEPGPIVVDASRGDVWVGTNGYPSSSIQRVSLTNFSTFGSLPGSLGVTALAIDSNASDLFAGLAGGQLVDYNLSRRVVVGSVELAESPNALIFDSSSRTLFAAIGGSDAIQAVNVTSFVVTDTIGVGGNPVGMALDPANDRLYVANAATPNLTVVDLATRATTSVPTGYPSSGLAYDTASDCVIAVQPQRGTAEFVPSVGSYLVTAQESGLPIGWAWSLQVENRTYTSTTAAIPLYLSNGSYSYRAYTTLPYRSTPSTGEFGVAGGGSTVEVAFGLVPPPEFAVVFSASGLTQGLTWAITLNGTGSPRASGSISFNESNGTYPFYVTPPTGYLARPASGEVVVTGQAVSISIVIEPAPAELFPTTFQASGLNPEAEWSVSIGGLRVFDSNTSALVINLSNGTYSWSIGPPTGFTSQIPNGTLTVSGAAQTVAVTFTSAPAGPSNHGGVATTELVLAGVLVVVLASAVIIYLARRHRGPPPDTAPLPSSAQR